MMVDINAAHESENNEEYQCKTLPFSPLWLPTETTPPVTCDTPSISGMDMDSDMMVDNEDSQDLPVPMEVDSQRINDEEYSDNESEDSDGYCTSNEENNEYEETNVTEREECPTVSERKYFSTPCGQTYWVDEDYLLYTNKTVPLPIGYWCDYNQCVRLTDDISDESSDDEEIDVPPTPPPIYEERHSLDGSIASMDTDDFVEGEIIVITNNTH